MATARRLLSLALLVVVSASPTPAKDPDPGIGIDAAIERAIRWLPSAEIDPFRRGADSFRAYMIEVEIWHRLTVFENNPTRRRNFEEETVRRLRKGLDARGLTGMLDGENGRMVLTEVAVFARRCRDHGLDPEPVRGALAAHRSLLVSEVAHVPVSLRALYAAYLPAAGMAPPISLDACRASGMLATRPREVDLTLADVYYLTHEVFAYTDYGLRPLTGMTPAEEAYLLRVMPFYTSFYLTLGQVDIAAELIICLHAAGMRDTYAYREGIRTIVEHQSADGSFGATAEGRPKDPGLTLHVTLNALSALLLDRSDRSDDDD